jgi:hypothetical protein
MKKKIRYKEDGRIYDVKDISLLLSDSVAEANLLGNSKGMYYYNVPCSFDIETSSFYRDRDGVQYSLGQVEDIRRKVGKKVEFEKVAAMYVWQFGINGNVIVGRTWEQFLSCMQTVSDELGLSDKRRLIVYVHNLSYEFQFIRCLFEWQKVFSIDLRKPIYAITVGNIEFRCSYLLSGYGLDRLGKQLNRYKVQKMSGDLDYSLIRNSVTPLTDKELGYCVNDVRVVMSYIQEQIEDCKGITNIPLTKTGFVRKHCRKNCLYFIDPFGKRQQNWDYLNLMRELQITGLHEFNMLQRAFSGGFTHANAYYTDSVETDVASYDFTSSYPFVMVSEKFPMSGGVKVKLKSKEQFNFLLSKYCCIFDITFDNIVSKLSQDTPISVSKCWEKENVVENNGRVFSASHIGTTITNVDFEIYKDFYTWDAAHVGEIYCYRKDYLPTEFVRSILELYEKKTTLKGVKGMEVEYLNSKEMLNSCYGMSVTNPLRDEFTYNGNWDVSSYTTDELNELLYKYNTSKNRFLFYPWGIFVTAYARRNLFTAIKEMGQDYIYSDTDSVKILNHELHKEYFDRYNNDVYNKLKLSAAHHKIDFEKYEPKTIKGVTKLLGVWDFEGVYKRFKTLGAKRYMVEEEQALTVDGVDYDFSLTVSGLNKKFAIPYLLKTYGVDGIFSAFSNYLHIPTSGTGKNLHTYVDYETSGNVVDYLGNVAPFKEKTCLHLEPVDYHLSLAILYLKYLQGIRFKE